MDTPKPPRIVVQQEASQTKRSFLQVVWQGVEQTCFIAGSIIVWPIQLAVQANKKQPEFRTPKQSWKTRLGAAVQRGQTKRRLTTLGAFALVVMIVFAVSHIGVLGLAIKGRVLGRATSGLEALTAANTALEQNNIASTNKKLQEAYNAFNQAQGTIADSNIILQGLATLIPAARDGDKVLTATTLLTKAGITASDTAVLGSHIHITAQGLAGDDARTTAQSIINNIRSLVTDVTKAAQELDDVNPKNIPEAYQAKLTQVQSALQSLQGNLQTIGSIANVVEQIVTEKHHVLVLLQNNNELRASGGFIGTVGVVDIDHGTVTKTDIRSVYDYDGQLQSFFRPPSPIVAVNNRLYLRDSNWFTDFPSSAQTVSRFFEREGGETPSLVIALTPETISQLLKVTGPLSVSGSSITADNITELLQTQTSLNYDKVANNPKQLLADAFPVLMQKLGDLKGSQLLDAWQAITNSLSNKQLLLTSSQPALEQQLASLHWNGAVQNTDRDFLLISSSNLGGTKTDQFLQKKYALNTTINSAGRVTNTVTITVTNPLPKEDGLGNTSFWRIYTPEGSRLLGSEGFTSVTLPRLDDKRYTEDSSIAAWNQSTSIDNNTGTFTSKENGKTVFGNWLTVAGGESKTVRISYQVPWSLKNIDRYSMVWQKQPGSIQEQYSSTIESDNHTTLWRSHNWPQNEATLTGDLTHDIWYGIVLKQQ